MIRCKPVIFKSIQDEFKRLDFVALSYEKKVFQRSNQLKLVWCLAIKYAMPGGGAEKILSPPLSLVPWILQKSLNYRQTNSES